MMLLIPLLFILILPLNSLKLSEKLNWILKHNCGRYVEGYNSASNISTKSSWKSLYGKLVNSSQEAPWAVPVAYKQQRNENRTVIVHRGSGTIISPYHILTAAHLIGIKGQVKNCSTGELGTASYALTEENLVIYTNVTCATKRRCKIMRRKETFNPLEVAKIYVAHGYVGEACEKSESNNDLAVLELKKPLNFSSDVWPVCLPSPDTTLEDVPHFDLYGYGLAPETEHPFNSGLLRHLRTKLDKCSKEFPEEKGFFCTKAPNAGLSCAGDSGVGFVGEKRGENRKTVFGVLSGGVTCNSLYEKHKQERKKNGTLTTSFDLNINLRLFRGFLCQCCGLCP